MQYQEAVQEARRLVKRSEEDQWRLAQLTWEQTRQHGVSAQKWAEDIGVHFSTVYRWRLERGMGGGGSPRLERV